MYLPASLPNAGRLCSPSLDNTDFTLIRGYSYQENRRTTPFAFVALLLFVLPLLFTFQKFVALERFAPRSQKFVADNPL